jgi:ATP-binding cassette subfamily B protein
MKSLGRLVRFVKPYWWQVVLALLLLGGMTASDLLVPRLTQRLIDEGVTPGDMGVVGSTALLMLAASVVSALCAVGNTILAVRVGQNVGADLRSAVVRQVQRFSFGNLDQIQTGQLLVRATSDVNQVQTIFQMSMRILSRAPLWIIGSMIMLVTTSKTLALFMLALLPLIGVMIWVLMFKARPMFERVQKKLDALNQVLQENLSGVRVIKAFVRATHEAARFGRANDELTEENVQVTQLVAMLLPSMRFIVNLGIVGVVWIGGSLVLEGDFAVGKMVASISYMTRSLFPLLMLGGMIGPISAADASAARILEVLDSEPEVQDAAQAKGLAAVEGRVSFENVSFRYNGDEQEAVLKNVNLVAEPGETVAILGATGSGKSTLVNLIPRFYDVNEGRVLLDGVDVREMPLEQLRAQTGVALQEAVLFTGTVRDNIRYGRPEATDEQVIAAAQAAQAHDFVMSFPQGYDTMVGQRGVNLSGGQKQRLSIARALLVQPKVLILDDSTSAVDVETEAKIQAELDVLMEDRTSPSAPFRTSFVIAQRISTVLNADKIVVLDEGQVADVGTHEQLMARSPIYQEIYESQLGDGESKNGK